MYVAKTAIVHCRLCKKEINRTIQKENEDWIMRSRGWYYHCSCYDDWIKKKDDIHTNDMDEELWKDAAYQYLHRDLRISIDFVKFDSQWKNFRKQGKTAKGIYFSLRYFYEIKKGDADKAQEGIGIIKFIYTEAGAYWVERESKERGIVAKIEEQIRQMHNQDVKKVTSKQTTKKKKIQDLSAISLMEDDE